MVLSCITVVMYLGEINLKDLVALQKQLVDLNAQPANGDLNGDFTVSDADLRSLQQFINSGDTTYIAEYDINDDGVINAKDIVRVKKIIAGIA